MRACVCASQTRQARLMMLRSLQKRVREAEAFCVGSQPPSDAKLDGALRTFLLEPRGWLDLQPEKKSRQSSATGSSTRCFFVLDGAQAHYFSSEDELTDRTKLGRIVLQNDASALKDCGIVVEPLTGEPCLVVTTPKRSFRLQHSDDEQLVQWSAVFRRVSARKYNPPPPALPDLSLALRQVGGGKNTAAGMAAAAGVVKGKRSANSGAGAGAGAAAAGATASTSFNMFEVEFKKGPLGLNLARSVKSEPLVVGFLDLPDGGGKGQAEQGGKIAPGDLIVSVNGVWLEKSCSSFEQATMLIRRAAFPINLTFKRENTGDGQQQHLMQGWAMRLCEDGKFRKQFLELQAKELSVFWKYDNGFKGDPALTVPLSSVLSITPVTDKQSAAEDTEQAYVQDSGAPRRPYKWRHVIIIIISGSIAVFIFFIFFQQRAVRSCVRARGVHEAVGAAHPRGRFGRPRRRRRWRRKRSRRRNRWHNRGRSRRRQHEQEQGAACVLESAARDRPGRRWQRDFGREQVGQLPPPVARPGSPDSPDRRPGRVCRLGPVGQGGCSGGTGSCRCGDSGFRGDRVNRRDRRKQ